ncbi:hypothetical protein BKA69DRAFT_421698 [Paraphysoderma sedebokerense]|nr:hypothetical protein BKA69DRAFT_421698 [Paraphysoderma sedebokerense]
MHFAPPPIIRRLRSFVSRKNRVEPSNFQAAEVVVTSETNSETRHSCKSSASCGICLEDIDTCDRKQCTTLRCSHSFCKSCLRYYVKSTLDDQSQSNTDPRVLTCPEFGCQEEIASRISKTFLERSDYLRFKDYDRESRMAHRVYCPMCNVAVEFNRLKYKGVPPKVMNAAKVKCRNKHKICGFCLCPYHDGFTCFDIQRHVRRSHEQRSSNLARLITLDFDDQNCENEFGGDPNSDSDTPIFDTLPPHITAADVKFIQLCLKAKWKKCPGANCGMWVEKNQGCNAMKCVVCKTTWCYGCGMHKQPFQGCACVDVVDLRWRPPRYRPG